MSNQKEYTVVLGQALDAPDSVNGVIRILLKSEAEDVIKEVQQRIKERGLVLGEERLRPDKLDAILDLQGKFGFTNSFDRVSHGISEVWLKKGADGEPTQILGKIKCSSNKSGENLAKILEGTDATPVFGIRGIRRIHDGKLFVDTWGFIGTTPK